jgi:hypothetical protein
MRAMVAVVGVIAATLAGCDLTGAPDPGPPEQWQLGPVKPGGVLVLPRDPCTGTGEIVRRKFVPADGTSRIEPLRIGLESRGSDAALRLEIPANLPEYDYNYFYECLTMGVNVAATYEDFTFEVEVDDD